MNRLIQNSAWCALAITAAACAGKRGVGETAAVSCEPVEGGLAGDVSAADLAGEYRLTLVATGGDSTGKTADGRLSLHPHESSARQVMVAGVPDPNVSIPLYGAMELDLEVINALRLGDLASLDPMRPGVAVFESRGVREGAAAPFTEIIMRLGSIVNRRDVTLFDAGYSVLRLNWVDETSFGGTWESGVAGPRSRGHFCAFRSSGS